LIIEAGLFAVDVFFYVGGLLVAYVVLRDSSKNNLKYLVAIFQRFLRFWPSYLFAIMVYYSVYLHLGSGPIWGSDTESVLWCQKIWKPFFFIDNLVDNG
jgi:peptidoglycan/LPS O-acetylase OafA/YrhL